MVKQFFSSWMGWLTTYFIFWMVSVIMIGSVFADIIRLVLVFIFLFAVRDIFIGILQKNDLHALKQRGKQSLLTASLLLVGILIIAAIFSSDGTNAASIIGAPTIGLILLLMISGIICSIRSKRYAINK